MRVVRRLYKDRRWNALVGAWNAGFAAIATTLALALAFQRGGETTSIGLGLAMLVVGVAASATVLGWYIVRLEVTLDGEIVGVRGPTRVEQVDRASIVDLEPTQFMNGTYCVTLVLDTGRRVRAVAVPFRQRAALTEGLPHLADRIGSERRVRDRTGRLFSVNVLRGRAADADADWEIWVMRPRLPLARPRQIGSGLGKAAATRQADQLGDQIRLARRWRWST